MNAPGLRERKKQKTRWSIQEHALRLFAEQGYEATTVEQIAAAAEVSPSTFFRYFPSKEDVVVQDEYDPVLAAALAAAPPGLGALATLRHAVLAGFQSFPPGALEKVVERGRLALSVPALRARTVDNMATTVDLIAAPLARRAGRPPDDPAYRVLAGACLGAMTVAIFEWLGEAPKGAGPGERIDAALAAVEAGFSGM
ncbi:acyl-CoA-like ligand-binding transcription factor [Rhizomonospora bruguierae]|uniref:acyl-CoA-like ligand-binding transcription factor n=1 Tax=Rhizomonospora bruguierae TaxID=1581705 RepID=UPI001BCC41F5|nr:TetR family transcriptional regulator [Micromonospora sp. NBRC 107566]